MKRTWKISLLIAWVFILLEALTIFIIFKPYTDLYRLYKNIDDGRNGATYDVYQSLSSSNKDKVQANLDDYAAYVCERYIANEISYEDAIASFDSIKKIDNTGTVCDQFLSKLNANEFRVVINGIFNAKEKYDNTLYMEYTNRLTLLSQRMQNGEKEQILIEMLNQYYQEYLEGMISDKKMSIFIGLVSSVAYYDAYEYANLIQMNVNHVSEYRTRYQEAQTYFSNEDYFTVMDICKKACIDPYDVKYQEQYNTLYNDAYALGKLYYDDALNDLIAAGEKEDAVKLMEKIASNYGEDFDLSSATLALAQDWQIAYVDFIANAEGYLVRDMVSTEIGQEIYMNYYEQYKPNSISVHDIDKDGIPEMFLFNDSQIENDYISCFVYKYNGNGGCSYIGYANVRSYGTDSVLVAAPNIFDREIGEEEYCLVWYDGETFNPGSLCQNVGDTYYVDGEEVSELDYMSARTDVLAYADAYNVGNSKYENLSNGKNYILAYGE